MANQTAKLNTYWSSLIIEELIRQGCNYFCISPGSRSTPLTIAVAQNSKAISKIFYDERGSAFHALGYSKATGIPAVLICTSGTAAANYYPAIVEAFQDSIPLIILTADRPSELRDSGANQTIDQVKIYGDFVNWYFEMPAPTENISPKFLLTTIDQAYFKAIGFPKGPVHINCQYREPFYDNDISEFSKIVTMQKWKTSERPFTTYKLGETNDIANDNFIELFNSVDRGIILAGKLKNSYEYDAVLSLANQMNWPILPDITSRFRGNSKSDTIIEYYDLLLLSEMFKNALRPKMVIQFGKRFISKRLLMYLNDLKPENYVLVEESSNRYDPMHIVSDRIITNISHFCENIISQTNKKKDKNYVAKLIDFNNKVGNFLKNYFNQNVKISEISIARTISRLLPDNSGMFLASSMPVRDMDMFAIKKDRKIFVTANRGASGIDGSIASAIGFAQGINSNVTLLLGDLAFIHDLNSLHQLSETEHQIIMVLINNQGGGIFSFLPIANQTDNFEKYFATPHKMTFKNAAKLFNLDYFFPQSISDLQKNYKSAINLKNSTIIELHINRNENLRLHQNLYNKIVEILEK